MKKTLQRGFTLIELLVVIAIIGILAAVVLASLNDARNGGTDASIKQTLSNLRSQAEISYNQQSFSYAAICNATTNPKIEQLLVAATASSKATMLADDAAIVAANLTEAVCRDSATGWLVAFPLVGTGTAGDRWCVDSAGLSQLVPIGSVANITGATDLGCGA